jgi:tRNA pseudouridine32 synthase/23S rRNA pseudouridine746 synthase
MSKPEKLTGGLGRIGIHADRRPQPCTCLFTDTRFVVIDKPPGLPVHPGPKGGPSVEDFFPHLTRRRDGPWLAHRLDADTSGCLVIALRKAALLAAQAEFAAGRAEKTYWAIVQGSLASGHGVIEAPLAKRSTQQAGWRMVIDPSGQRAITEWRVLGRGEGITWLEVRPRTGRTHQIRAHCAHIGHPLLGDPIYGAGHGRLQLLARGIRLNLDPVVAAVAEPLADMLAVIRGMKEA